MRNRISLSKLAISNIRTKTDFDRLIKKKIYPVWNIQLAKEEAKFECKTIVGFADKAESSK